jgi:beta-glucosidase
LKQAGADAPKFSPDDLKMIAEPVDFVGINVYRPTMYVVATDQAPGYRDVGLSKSHPKMFSSWHVLGAEALYWAPRHVRTLWNAKEIHITENGCASVLVQFGLWCEGQVSHCKSVSCGNGFAGAGVEPATC